LKISNLQLLRAFAALNVVFFHIIGTSKAYGFGVVSLSFLEGWGGNGVDIFFVISGFIMVYIQNLKGRTPQEFAVDRIVRIVPVYWLLTILVIVSFFILPSSSLNSTSPGISELISSLLFIHQPMYESTPILFVGWTLEYEMMFYMIFAASILIKKRIYSYILVLIALAVSHLYFEANPIVYEFFFGMLLGYFHLFYKARNDVGICALSLGVIGLTLPLFSNVLSFVDNRVIYSGIPSLLIVFGAIYSKQFNNSVMAILGNASYSIYLIQVFTIPIFYKALTLINIGEIDTDMLAFLCLAFTSIAGVVCYWLFEKPVSFYFKKKFNAKNFAPAI